MTQPPAFRHRTAAMLSALLVLALVIRIIVARFWHFDGLYGQDAFAYFDQALAISESLKQGLWAPPAFHWPNGFPALAGLTMLVFGVTPSAVQALNMVLGVAVVLLVYLIGRDTMKKESGEIHHTHRDPAQGVGLLAAAITAFAGQLVLSSVVFMADMAALFWLTLAAWLLIRLLKSPSAWGLTVAAAAAGATAVITRWASGLAAPAFAAATAFGLRNERRRILPLLVALTAALVIALPQVFASMSAGGSGFSVYFKGWSIFNFFGRTFEVNQGFVSHRFPNWVFFAAPFWHPSLMPPTMGLFAVPGLFALWRRRKVGEVLLFGIWLLVPYLFFAGLPTQNLRFCLTMWVPAVLLASVGAVDLWLRPSRRALVAGLLLISLLGSGIWNASRWDRFFGSQHRLTNLARDLDERLPAEAVILSFEATLTLDHYTNADVQELYWMDTKDLQTITEQDIPVWVIVNPASIEKQWKTETPGHNLEWLHQHRNLRLVEERGPWVVYRIAFFDPQRGRP